jgi:hypothetical protein
MNFKVGDKVLVVHDWSDSSQNAEGTVIKWRPEREECRLQTTLGNKEPVDSWHNTAYVFPLSARMDILTVQNQRAQLKRAFDDSMKLVYEVCNKRSRGEYT